MFSKIVIPAVIAVTSFAIGCGGGAAPNANSAPANAAPNSNNPVATTQTKPAEPTNDAPTLTPAVKAYCDAWAKSDEAALRKVYSSDTLKDFDSDMKEAKEKSLVKFLEDDKLAGTLCEVSNEEIKGDTGTVRLVASKYPKGIRLVFVKEGGEWKLTNRVPDVDAVKSASNSAANTAK